MDANRGIDAAELRRRQAEADKQRRMEQFDKDQAAHEQALQKGDAVEAYKDQARQQAEADKQKRIDDLTAQQSGAYNVSKYDLYYYYD